MMAYYNPDCSVENGKKHEVNVVMSPFIVDGQVRVVVTWEPLKVRDMDSFMLTP
jgi:hypothetical protein